MAQTVKRLPAMRETRVRSLGQEDPLEKEMATHSSTLAWKIPWMEEPDGLQSMGSQRVGQDWMISLHFTSVSFQRRPLGYRIKDTQWWTPPHSHLRVTCFSSKFKVHWSQDLWNKESAWSGDLKTSGPLPLYTRGVGNACPFYLDLILA